MAILTELRLFPASATFHRFIPQHGLAFPALDLSEDLVLRTINSRTGKRGQTAEKLMFFCNAESATDHSKCGFPSQWLLDRVCDPDRHYELQTWGFSINHGEQQRVVVDCFVRLTTSLTQLITEETSVQSNSTVHENVSRMKRAKRTGAIPFQVRHLFKEAFDQVWGRYVETGDPFKRKDAPLWMNNMTATIFLAKVKLSTGFALPQGVNDVLRYSAYATDYAQDRRANLVKADKKGNVRERLEDIEIAKKWRSSLFYEAFKTHHVPYLNGAGEIALHACGDTPILGASPSPTGPAGCASLPPSDRPLPVTKNFSQAKRPRAWDKQGRSPMTVLAYTTTAAATSSDGPSERNTLGAAGGRIVSDGNDLRLQKLRSVTDILNSCSSENNEENDQDTYAREDGEHEDLPVVSDAVEVPVRRRTQRAAAAHHAVIRPRGAS